MYASSRDQVNDRVAKTESAELRASGQALVAKLTEIEETIYQTKSHASEDPLNFPIKINNRMAPDGRDRGSDAKPTIKLCRFQETFRGTRCCAREFQERAKR